MTDEVSRIAEMVAAALITEDERERPRVAPSRILFSALSNVATDENIDAKCVCGKRGLVGEKCKRCNEYFSL